LRVSAELEQRWSAWLLCRKRRDPLVVSGAVACLDLAFSGFDYGDDQSDMPETDSVRKLDSRIDRMLAVSQAGVRRIAGTVQLMMRYTPEGYSRRPRMLDADSESSISVPIAPSLEAVG
jgi:hypothetical protein